MSFVSIYTFGAQHYEVEDGFALLKVDAMRIDTFQRNIPIYYLLASSTTGEGISPYTCYYNKNVELGNFLFSKI